MRGTPRNLSEAIFNGLHEIQEERDLPIDCIHPVDVTAKIRSHVQDLLAQKFQAAKFLAHQNCFSTEKDLQLLFDACTLDNPPLVIKETNND